MRFRHWLSKRPRRLVKIAAKRVVRIRPVKVLKDAILGAKK
jgi:hypothetical protein